MPKKSKLTACVESISLMLWSYCSAKIANFRVCSSFSRFRTALCSLFGVVSSRWFLNALYCLVWILQVSWNCFFIWSSLDWGKKKKIYVSCNTRYLVYGMLTYMKIKTIRKKWEENQTGQIIKLQILFALGYLAKPLTEIYAVLRQKTSFKTLGHKEHHLW